jgi:DNA-directed RNA polymerase specialized sigma subunit
MDQKKKFFHDRQFQDLATQVNAQINENKDLIGDQEQQVKLLVSLEKKFQFYLLKNSQAVIVYKKFIHFILKENNNLLSAQPYFRETSALFRSKITRDIRDGNVQAVMKYAINYAFIEFIKQHWEGPFPEKVQQYHTELVEARRILIENNLPLAINRAKLFYRKTPRSHLGLLDLIDICTCGLINGIDKYVGAYRSVWRSVCIGRMVGHMIEEYSKTFLRLYPADRKILYRANSLKFKLQLETVPEITKAVNDSFYEDLKNGLKVPKLPIEEYYIQTIMNSMSYLSTDSKANEDPNGEEEGACLYDCTAAEENVEDNVITAELNVKMVGAYKDLEVVEQKVLKLKGIEL